MSTQTNNSIGSKAGQLPKAGAYSHLGVSPRMQAVIKAHTDKKAGVAEFSGPPCMTAAGIAFLSLLNYPGRFNVWQAAVLLNCTEEDVRFLVGEGLLKRLNEGAGTTTYISTEEVMAIKQSAEAMGAITRAINGRWASEAAEKKLKTQPAGQSK